VAKSKPSPATKPSSKPAPKRATTRGRASSAKAAARKPAGRPATVAAYLAALPPDRRAAVSAVRDAINRALPAGYEEGMAYGMIGWAVPHRLYPAGYHCDPKQPLPFAGLASQKGHMSLHLMCTYFDDEQRRRLEDDWRRTGKKLDMGKACIRFKALDDLPLDVVTAAVARVPVAAYVQRYEALLARGKSRKA
jgi:hypothetical protein